MERSFRHLQEKLRKVEFNSPIAAPIALTRNAKRLASLQRIIGILRRSPVLYRTICKSAGHFEHTSPVAIFGQSTWKEKWGSWLRDSSGGCDHISRTYRAAPTNRCHPQPSDATRREGKGTQVSNHARGTERIFHEFRRPPAQPPGSPSPRRCAARPGMTMWVAALRRVQGFLGCHSSIFVPSGSTIQANFPAASSWLRLRTVTPLASIRARNASRSSTAKSTMNSRVDGAM